MTGGFTLLNAIRNPLFRVDRFCPQNRRLCFDFCACGQVLGNGLSVKAEKYFENQNLKERKKMAEQEEQKKEPDSKRVHTYPLIRVSIMELKFLAFLEMLTIYLCLHQTKLPTIVFNLIKMIDCF